MEEHIGEMDEVWPDWGGSGPVGFDERGDEDGFRVVEEVHFKTELDDWVDHVDCVCCVVVDKDK